MLNKIKGLKGKYSLIAIFLLIFLMSYLTPYYGDEYIYSFIFPLDAKPELLTRRVENLIEVFQSTYRIYMTWGGRILHNFSETLFLYIGKVYFCVINSFIFIFILKKSKELILKYNSKLKFGNTEYIILFSLFWYLVPAFNQDFIGMVSSIHYSWMLLILVFYITDFDKMNEKQLIIYSFIVGLTNESVVIFINIYLFYQKIVLKKNIKFFVLISLWLSSIIQIFSPGNFNRKIYTDSLNVTQPIIQKITLFLNMNHTILIGKIFISLLLLIIYLNIRGKNNYIIPKDLIISCSITLIILLFLMPQNEPRTYLLPFYFFIISIFIFLKYLFIDNIKLSIMTKIFIYFILTLSLSNVLPYYLKTVNNLNEERKTMINYYRKKGIKEVTFYNNEDTTNTIATPYRVFETLSLNYQTFVNIAFAKYYNFNKVYSIPRKNKLLVVKTEKNESIDLEIDSKEQKNISQNNNEILFLLPENAKNIEIKSKNVKIVEIKIVEAYKGTTLSIKKNIKKIELE